MTTWLAAFLATCAIELAVVRLMQRRARVSIVLGAQLATHPVVWIAMTVLGGPVIVRLAAVELWAMLVEAAIYRRFLGLAAIDALALSATANAASLLALALV